MFGVTDPRELVQPGQREQWSGDEHQAEALLYLAREGVEASVVQEMPDYAIKRIAAYGGEPVPDHEVEHFVKRYGGKVPAPTLAKLVDWFRNEVEGGGAR